MYIRLPLTWNYKDEQVTNYGYVDHQSMDLLESFLRTNNITLDDFIFNDKYIVIVDGDEYNTFERLQACGLLDKNALKKG